MSITIQQGLTPQQTPAAAALFCRALHEKITPVLGDIPRATAFLTPAFEPDRAIIALRDDQLLGIAGYKVDGRGIINRNLTLKRFWNEYGISAPLRILGLLILDSMNHSNGLLIDSLVVHEDTRGQGIGTMLLDAAEQRARELGINQMSISVIDSNPRAQALYERNGFTTSKVEHLGPLKRFFPFRSVINMTRELSPSAVPSPTCPSASPSD